MFVRELTEILTSSVGYLAATYIILLLSYRLLIHPLHRYPGPFLAKLTQLHAGYYAIRRRLHLEIYDYHLKYGPVVRVGPNRLVFSTITALHDIFENERVTKSAETYLTTSRNNVFSVFTAIDNELHRQKRQVVGQVVSERSMRAFEPTMMQQVDIFLRQIAQQAQSSTPVDMTAKARYLALDVIGLLSFGYELGVQTREENRFVIKAMNFGNYRGNVYGHVPFISKLYVDKIGDRIFYEVREKYWRLLETMVAARLAQDKDAIHDFYSVVADGMQTTYRHGDLWREALFFITAGGYTVATAISASFFYLSRNKECYQRLSAEIRSVFTSGADIKTGPQLAECHYLRACIDESLRMTSPITTTLWREQVRDDKEPLVVDGHVIPRGTLIGMNPYVLHHNPEYFPDPFTFHPERWLAPMSPQRKLMYDAFVPFSVGARNCGGKAMAYQEVSLVLAKSLWYFEFERAPGPLGDIGGGKQGRTDGRGRPDEYQTYDIFTSRHEGPFLIFTPRGDLWKELEASV
ncbi:cytochrome P450 [Xylariomycetidae sp. FL2044]|nr:cytochrome P450 [Xylariomycetidae sp. FL2044]